MLGQETVKYVRNVFKYNVAYKLAQQTEADRANGADDAGQHERMVQQVFADARRTRAVELHRGDERTVVWDEEIAVHRREHADEKRRWDAQR